MVSGEAHSVSPDDSTAKDSAEIFNYYAGNDFSIPWHFAKGYESFF